MRTIKIGENEFEICCDINALEKIQEDFGGVVAFEKGLLGIVGEKEVKNEIGIIEKRNIYGEPSYKAIRVGAVHMINEAIEIYNDEHEEKKEYLTMEKIKRLHWNAGTITDIARDLHDEFTECFRQEAPKKQKNKQKAETEE